MESKRHDDLDGELDIQALLDKYLPEEQTGSDEDLPAEDSAELTDEEFFDDEVVTEEAQDAPDGKEELYMNDVAEDEQESFDGFVISDDSADDGASGKDFYDAYKEFSDNVESDDTKDDTALDWGAVTEDNDGENTESAADAVLKLDDDELVLDEDIIAELMATDEAQFGGIEGFEDIEDLSGYDVTGTQNAVSANDAEEEDIQIAEPVSAYDEHADEDAATDSAEDFVGSTIDELSNDETDMDFIVAFGLEDELGRHVGDKKASRLKKKYEEVVERREEIDRKTVQNEYKDLSQNREIIEQYKKAYFSSKIKILISAVLALILLFYENLPLIGYQLASYLDPAVYPVAYVMIDLQITLLAIAAVYDSVFRGFVRLFKGKPSPESILSIAAVLSIIYSAIVAKTAVPPTEPTLFNFPVAFCAFLTAVYSYLTIKREIFSFNVVSSKKPKFALRRLSSKDAVMEAAAFADGKGDIGDILKIEKVSFVDGYFYRTESVNTTNSAAVLMSLGLSLVLAVLFGVYAAMVNKSATSALVMGYAAFVTAVPMSLLFSQSYPFFKANSISYDENSTIIGENSLEEYSGASVISFDDKLVFPSVGVKVQNIKVYNNYRFDRVLYYAASVFTKTGGPLSDVFEIATVESGYSDDVLLTGIGDGYIQTEVDGKSIMFGRAENLKELGVEIPEEIRAEDDYEDELSVMYMIFKGKIVAKMNILYLIDSDFEYIMKQLAGSGMSVCVKTLDPNIDEQMIKSKVKTDKYPMRVIRYSSLEEVANVAEHSDSGVVARGSSKGLLETVTFCDKVLDIKRTNSFIALLQAIISIVILAIVLLSNEFSSFRSLLSVLMQLFWLIPMAIVTRSMLK